MAAWVSRLIGSALLLCTCATGALADAESQARERLHIIVGGLRETIGAIPQHSRPAEYDSLLSGPLERLRVVESRLPLAVIGKIPRSRMTEPLRATDAATLRRADIREAMEAWNLQGLADSAQNRLRADDFQRLDETIEQYNDALLDRAIASSDDWLHAFEVKYGEGAPKLNLAEVVLNGAAQKLAAFQPNDKGPSANEIVLGYSTAWATTVDAEAKAVSTLEAGWRRYLFSWQAGNHSDWTGILRPRYWTLGVIVASRDDGALRWPLDGAASKETRVGPYLSWGDLRAGVLLGSEKRFIVSRQVQLLPGLF